MPLVTYVEHGGIRHALALAEGCSVMEGALDRGVPGIVGECGGGLACATCHCYVDAAWIDRVGRPQGVELDMLECTASEARPGSRLSCQIIVNADLDGLLVHLPQTQI